ncbi:hypothetical protein OHC33_006101 [Knufia fluminis]|uniref:Uncharacterized protein n=1 Tax=Knufia fluminis TaxID=191047 RepID=A0AAN8EP69_9EURO|nr:hypothetical protein OHC33_006101 [Knufia fluminis]
MDPRRLFAKLTGTEMGTFGFICVEVVMFASLLVRDMPSELQSPANEIPRQSPRYPRRDRPIVGFGDSLLSSLVFTRGNTTKAPSSSAGNIQETFQPLAGPAYASAGAASISDSNMVIIFCVITFAVYLTGVQVFKFLGRKRAERIATRTISVNKESATRRGKEAVARSRPRGTVLFGRDQPGYKELVASFKADSKRFNEKLREMPSTRSDEFEILIARFRLDSKRLDGKLKRIWPLKFGKKAFRNASTQTNLAGNEMVFLEGSDDMEWEMV